MTKRTKKITVSNTFDNNDILCFTETWGNECCNYNVDNFEFRVVFVSMLEMSLCLKIRWSSLLLQITVKWNVLWCFMKNR